MKEAAGVGTAVSTYLYRIKTQTVYFGLVTGTSAVPSQCSQRTEGIRKRSAAVSD